MRDSRFDATNVNTWHHIYISGVTAACVCVCVRVVVAASARRAHPAPRASHASSSSAWRTRTHAHASPFADGASLKGATIVESSIA